MKVTSRVHKFHSWPDSLFYIANLGIIEIKINDADQFLQ